MNNEIKSKEEISFFFFFFIVISIQINGGKKTISRQHRQILAKNECGDKQVRALYAATRTKRIN